MNSKSLNYYKKKGLIIEERSIPKISKNQMLIKVQSCGICGSDIKILKHGNPRVSSGRIMGHEISGEVIDVGDILDGFKIGDKVSIGADIPNKGDLAYGHELDGGFSQYMVLHSTHIKNGPVEKFKDIDYDIAALAEPLACCLNGYEKVQFKNYQSVLILGGGVIGLILSFIATLKNIPKIYIADISKERIKNFKKFDFITNYFDINHIKEKNEDFDLIFTANNNPQSQQQAIELINSGGVINFFGGLPKNQSYVDINTNKIHYEEVIVTGSHGSTPEQHKQAIGILEEHKSFFTMLISKKFAIADFEKAFQEATNPRNYKVIIKPNKN